MNQVGIVIVSLGVRSPIEAERMIRARILDTERQGLGGAANKSCSPLLVGIPIKPGQLAVFFYPEYPQEQHACSLARCNVMPSTVLYDRCK